MRTRYDIVNSIMRGELLTEEEFERAKALGYILEGVTYERFRLCYYEDDDNRGYLCVSDGKINSREHRRCFVGLHREDIEPEHLRDEQKELW